MEDVGREFRVDRVTLVHKDKLPRVRKKLGLGTPVSEVKKTMPGWDFFESAYAFAVIRQSGEHKEVERRCMEMVREELSILAVSHLGYSTRKQMGPIVAPGEIPNSFATFLAVDSRTNTRFGNRFKRTVPFAQMALEGRWKNYQDEVFFTKLLGILRGDTKVDTGWRQDLRRASVMIGESVGASDPFKSFLWNMIVLEMLLTKDEKGEMLDILPERVGTLLDFSPYWEAYNYRERLRNAYLKRNLLHQGRRDELTDGDLAFTDHLLVNVLMNLVSHPKLFNSKDAFIEFSKKVAAERTLGVRPRVRPKTLRFIRPVKPDF
jgi:hypothetical protein